MSQGEGWGGYRDDFDSICFTADDHLIAGRIRDWSAFNFLDDYDERGRQRSK